ncbi:MAG TPA: argininosuccinate lyase [Acidobacteriaceae bacterium]|nr:argininosuccinate lyase [Acidobacteriaceae bacterium]
MTEQPAKMWSGRFRAAPDAFFDQWQRSIRFDWRLLSAELQASSAHALALRAAGVLTDDDCSRIVRTLKAIGTDYSARPADVRDDPQAEDIHHFVELRLTEALGPLGLRLHSGRSRNEQIATDLRLFVRDAIDAANAKLTEWAIALLELADEVETSAMPAYTHLQRAEPVLVAHWLLAYVEMILRDISRFDDCRSRLNFCPLGSGAVAGATLALDRSIAARELNFTAPTANSMDATSDRDFALEFAQAASTLGIHLSRFAEELTLYSTSEFAFLDLPEEFSTGSSAMPQKKNPDLTELLRGKSGRLLGAAATLATLLKGLPLAYNKDMQETQEPVFAVADTLSGILALLPPFTRALHFRHDRMTAATQTGFLNAMAAATYLVHRGVPFRTAHEKIGNAVRYCVDKGCELGDLSLYELRRYGEEFDEDFFVAISLQATLDCHDVPGGTARHRVRAALADAQTRVQTLAARYGISPEAEPEDSHARA